MGSLGARRLASEPVALLSSSAPRAACTKRPLREDVEAREPSHRAGTALALPVLFVQTIDLAGLFPSHSLSYEPLQEVAGRQRQHLEMDRANPPHRPFDSRQEPATPVRRQLPLEDGREDLAQASVPRDRGDP